MGVLLRPPIPPKLAAHEKCPIRHGQGIDTKNTKKEKRKSVKKTMKWAVLGTFMAILKTYLW